MVRDSSTLMVAQYFKRKREVVEVWKFQILFMFFKEKVLFDFYNKKEGSGAGGRRDYFMLYLHFFVFFNCFRVSEAVFKGGNL